MASDDGMIVGHRVRVYPLVVDNGHFFNMSKPAKFLVEITLGRTNTQTKDAEHTARIRSLRLEL